MKEVLFFEELFNVFFFYIKTSRIIVRSYNVSIYIFGIVSFYLTQLQPKCKI